MFVFSIQSQVICVLVSSSFVCTMMASPLLIVAVINEVIKRPVAEIQCALIVMDKGTLPGIV